MNMIYVIIKDKSQALDAKQHGIEELTFHSKRKVKSFQIVNV